MDEQEKQFWTEKFNTLKLDWEGSIKRATTMATKYGKLCQKVDIFVSKHWYQKSENWIRIVTTSIIVIAVGLVLLKGGYVKYKDWEFGLNPISEVGTGSLTP